MRQDDGTRAITRFEKLLKVPPRAFLVERHHHMHRLPANTLHNPFPLQVQFGMRPWARVRLLDPISIEYHRMRRLLWIRGESDQRHTLGDLDDVRVERGWFSDVEVEYPGACLVAYAEEVVEALSGGKRVSEDLQDAGRRRT